MKDRKANILNHVEDLVSDFLYYQRKGDSELPRGEIESAIENGDIEIEDIVFEFENELRYHMGRRKNNVSH